MPPTKPFLRHGLALSTAAIVFLWARHLARSGAAGLAGKESLLLEFALGAVVLFSILLSGRDLYRGVTAGRVWIFLFGRDTKKWVAAGRALGFKSVYSEHLPPTPFAPVEQVMDVLGWHGADFDLFIAHRGEQRVVTGRQGGAAFYNSPTRNYDPQLSEPYPVETFALFQSHHQNWPRFELKPEGIWDKFLHRPDIDFANHKAFSSRYRLWGPSEAAIRALFTSARLNFLTDRPGWTIEADGAWLKLSRHQTLVSAAELSGFIGELLELRATLAERGSG